MWIQAASRRTKPGGFIGLAGLARASAVSMAAHALAATALFFAWPRFHRTQADTVLAATPAEVIDTSTANWVDVIPAAEAMADPLPPESQDEVLPGESGVMPGVSARAGIAVGARGLASDMGEETGTRTMPAFRRDRSTARQRLSNHVDAYQPEHERTAGRASSPQAERREPVVGIGDRSRSRDLAGEKGISLVATTSGVGEDGLASSGETAGHQETSARKEIGRGPLDAEEGERRFDVDREGPARDSRSAPLLSGELRPGRMDLSAVSAPGPVDGTPGRGPGEAPGAVPRVSSGSAPSPSGGLGTRPSGGDGDATYAGLRARHELEIGRRIHRQLRFPHRLALMLEQGETIVAFVVAADGRVAGPVDVVKSAGFSEFDDEAVAAVKRAAPFPPPGRALALSIRIPFQNPVVR